jgi:hypothetical protein
MRDRLVDADAIGRRPFSAPYLVMPATKPAHFGRMHRRIIQITRRCTALEPIH